MSEQTTSTRPLSRSALRSLSPLLWAVCLLSAPELLRAQAYTPPPPPLTTAPCVPTKKQPCDPPPASATPPASNDKFPFPGESPASATSPAPAAAGDKFPFPGEPPAPGPGSSSGSSSSSSSSSSSAADPFPFPGEDGSPSAPAGPKLRDKGSSGSIASARRRLPKVEDLQARESEDLEVSHFYLTSGDSIGAYNRAKDAIRIAPDDPEAHFALAAAAQKLKKKDEAIAEYKSYLHLEPDGDHTKAARQAIAEIH